MTRSVTRWRTTSKKGQSRGDHSRKTRRGDTTITDKVRVIANKVRVITIKVRSKTDKVKIIAYMVKPITDKIIPGKPDKETQR